MTQNYDKHIKVLLFVFYAALTILVLYFVFTKVLGWLMPFILAFFVAYATEPIVSFLEKKLKLKRVIATAITIILTLFGLGFLISSLVYRLFVELKIFAEQLPLSFNDLSGYVKMWTDKWVIFNSGLPVEMSDFIGSILGSINTNISSIVEPITKSTFTFAKIIATSLPNIIIFIVVFILSTFFISSDKDKIGAFLAKQLSNRWRDRLYSIKEFLFNALFKYLKALLILIFITFIELSIGFTIIGIDYAILFALFISVIDALPILGTGTVLIPWAIFNIALGDFKLGISLLIIYIIVLLVRQLLEPKIVSGQIGLYPLVTLMSMYVGLQLIGFFGMIAGPIVMLLLININRMGILRLWKQ